MDDYDEKLKQLHDNFRRQLPDRLESCLSAWKGYTNKDDGEALEQLRFHTHKLAGAASIYGFDTIGHSARAIELLVDQYNAGEITDPKSLSNQLTPQISELEKLILAVKSQSN